MSRPGRKGRRRPEGRTTSRRVGAAASGSTRPGGARFPKAPPPRCRGIGERAAARRQVSPESGGRGGRVRHRGRFASLDPDRVAVPAEEDALLEIVVEAAGKDGAAG